jgi:hypothetical protein
VKPFHSGSQFCLEMLGLPLPLQNPGDATASLSYTESRFPKKACSHQMDLRLAVRYSQATACLPCFLHYITLHYIALHCIACALHCIALHYMCIACALHCIALHYITLHCIALHVHCIALHYITLHYIFTP